MKTEKKSLKEGVNRILGKMNSSISELADETGYHPHEIENALDSSVPDMHIMEKLSKALRIPLYSFYHDEKANAGEPVYEPFYVNSLWEN
jgi:transcriptional regulator with XRE-family HTH domain